jgi:hypothetical protein
MEKFTPNKYEASSVQLKFFQKYLSTNLQYNKGPHEKNSNHQRTQLEPFR